MRRITAAVATLALSAASLQAQTASISGAVLLDGAEKPLRNAEVLLTGTNRSVRSDSAGNFNITGLRAGVHSVLVRLVGYEPFSAEITLGATQKFEADFLLKPVTTKLATVDVKAKPNNGLWTIKLAEFEERRKIGVGRYLTADIFEKENGRPASAFLMQYIPGIQFGHIDGKHVLSGSRNGMRGCYVQVIFNGLVRYNGLQGKGMEFDLDAINSSDIVGLEYYTVAQTPLQYNGTGGSTGPACGTVVIWTKGG